MLLFLTADTDRNIYMASCLYGMCSFWTDDKSFHLCCRCPECGRTPPGQKKAESFRKMIGRKLSVRKSVSFKSSSSNRSRESRDMGRQQRQQPQNWVMQVGTPSHVFWSQTRSSSSHSVCEVFNQFWCCLQSVFKLTSSWFQAGLSNPIIV